MGIGDLVVATFLTDGCKGPLAPPTTLTPRERARPLTAPMKRNVESVTTSPSTELTMIQDTAGAEKSKPRMVPGCAAPQPTGSSSGISTASSSTDSGDTCCSSCMPLRPSSFCLVPAQTWRWVHDRGARGGTAGLVKG